MLGLHNRWQTKARQRQIFGQYLLVDAHWALSWAFGCKSAPVMETIFRPGLDVWGVLLLGRWLQCLKFKKIKEKAHISRTVLDSQSRQFTPDKRNKSSGRKSARFACPPPHPHKSFTTNTIYNTSRDPKNETAVANASALEQAITGENLITSERIVKSYICPDVNVQVQNYTLSCNSWAAYFKQGE